MRGLWQIGRRSAIDEEPAGRETARSSPPIPDGNRHVRAKSDIARIEHEILERHSDDALHSIASKIGALPDPRHVLNRLARSDNAEVRGCVTVLAVDVLDRDAMPLLVRMFRDADADNRGLAYDAMERLDPEIADRLLPALRRRLRSLDDYEFMRTAWILAGMRDTASIPAVQSYLDAVSDQPTWWQYKAASVVLMTLTAPDTIAPAIRRHDHDRMAWLTYAAAIVGSDECLRALAWGAEHHPDGQCRVHCRTALEVYVPQEQRSRRRSTS